MTSPEPDIQRIDTAFHAVLEVLGMSFPVSDQREAAIAALEAVDAYDTRKLADLLVARYGKENVVGVIDSAEPLNQFEWLVAVIEHNLRIAKDAS